ncbi:hypothetical protein JKG41_15380 [Acidithiobacillus sp. MC2.1]|jgi:hypothetical protein|uniref:Uncharacterized protein n=2 Tax=Roseateles puraquae TaxID=431059 RepID=A0A254MZR9_9BURK|nr:hypothetical protein [Acidithiobacillus sp. MC2.2]MBN6746416.1 hypothetical protein [Acidithiobacillus sp. MC2.2]OWQ99907.1 hypothetical protein CDO81_25765 [Roseateles puraquae]
MRSFIRPRLMRTTIWVVLGAWLFSFAASMANACLLEAEGVHEHRQHMENAAHRHVEDEHGANSDHHDADSSKAACLKVCDGAKQSPVQKPLTLTFDLVGAPASSFEPWSAIPAMDPIVDVYSIRSLPPPTPPPRLLFTRLAL